MGFNSGFKGLKVNKCVLAELTLGVLSENTSGWLQ